MLGGPSVSARSGASRARTGDPLLAKRSVAVGERWPTHRETSNHNVFRCSFGKANVGLRQGGLSQFLSQFFRRCPDRFRREGPGRAFHALPLPSTATNRGTPARPLPPNRRCRKLPTTGRGCPLDRGRPPGGTLWVEDGIFLGMSTSLRDGGPSWCAQGILPRASGRPIPRLIGQRRGPLSGKGSHLHKPPRRSRATPPASPQCFDPPAVAVLGPTRPSRPPLCWKAPAANP